MNILTDFPAQSSDPQIAAHYQVAHSGQHCTLHIPPWLRSVLQKGNSCQRPSASDYLMSWSMRIDNPCNFILPRANNKFGSHIQQGLILL